MQWEETTSLCAGLQGILYDGGRVVGFLVNQGMHEYAVRVRAALLNFGTYPIPETAYHIAMGMEHFGNGLMQDGEMIAGDFCHQIADNVREFFMLNPHQKN